MVAVAFYWEFFRRTCLHHFLENKTISTVRLNLLDRSSAPTDYAIMSKNLVLALQRYKRVRLEQLADFPNAAALVKSEWTKLTKLEQLKFASTGVLPKSVAVAPPGGADSDKAGEQTGGASSSTATSARDRSGGEHASVDAAPGPGAAVGSRPPGAVLLGASIGACSAGVAGDINSSGAAATGSAAPHPNDGVEHRPDPKRRRLGGMLERQQAAALAMGAEVDRPLLTQQDDAKRRRTAEEKRAGGKSKKSTAPADPGPDIKVLFGQKRLRAKAALDLKREQSGVSPAGGGASSAAPHKQRLEKLSEAARKNAEKEACKPRTTLEDVERALSRPQLSCDSVVDEVPVADDGFGGGLQVTADELETGMDIRDVMEQEWRKRLQEDKLRAVIENAKAARAAGGASAGAAGGASSSGTVGGAASSSSGGAAGGGRGTLGQMGNS